MVDFNLVILNLLPAPPPPFWLWTVNVVGSNRTAGTRPDVIPRPVFFLNAPQGHLHTYRFCDNVWTFILQDATFKNEGNQENVGRVKIVACDSKLLTQ